MGAGDPDELSPVDRAIVARLQMDGRAPFSTIGSELGISGATVQRRVQQLMDKGHFKIIGVVDAQYSGRGHAVLVGIRLDVPAAIHTIPDRIAAIPESRFVAMVTGNFDVVCEIVTSQRDQLLRIVKDTMAEIPGIRGINTFWVLENFKSTYLWDKSALRGLLNPEAHSRPPLLNTPQETCPHRVELDDMDRVIVALLEQHGRITYAEIAAELDTALSTARRRTLRLLESGYIKVVAVGNPFRLGFEDVVLLWIKADLSRAMSIIDALRREPTIRYVSRVAGTVDIVAEALFPDRGALLAFLDGPLAAMDGIREVSTSVELANYKRSSIRFD
jgi:DNA-binding Lrp family transcriptional regulator